MQIPTMYLARSGSYGRAQRFCIIMAALRNAAVPRVEHNFHFALVKLVFLLLAGGASKLLAAETALYDISDASHPKPLLDQIERAAISSQSNDNMHYNL